MTVHSDALYHRLFSHPLMMEQLVTDFVPEAMAVGLDFARMERVNARFHDRDGRPRESDVIWRVPTGSGEIYLYVLCEFQSSIDWWMAVRTQVYQGLLWQHVIAEKALKSGDSLPPVLMLVLYNGERRWTAPDEVAALVALPPDSPLWPWQPRIRYHLLDMGAVPEQDLVGHDSLAALLFRLEQPGEPPELAMLVDDVVAWFRRHPGYGELKTLFTELVRQAIVGSEAPVPAVGELAEMRSMLATIGETWRKKWKAECKAEGLAEGLAEGIERGRAEGEALALIRVLNRRFGEVPAELRARILAAGEARVSTWLDRVVDAPSLDAVFGDAS